MTVAFDTETHGLDWFEADQGPFLATWSDPRGQDHLAHVDDARAMAAFKSDLKRSDLIVAHNLAFDAHQLARHCDFDVLGLGRRVVDTNVLAQTAIPERRFNPDPAAAEDAEHADATGYKLEALSRTYLPAEEQKIDLDELAKSHGISLNKQGGHYALWQAEPAAVEEYAMRDTRATIELLPRLEAKLRDSERPAWELEAAVTPHLIRAAYQGVTVDQSKITPLKATWTERRDRAYDNLLSVLGDGVLADPADPESKDSSEALAERLLALGVPLEERSEKTGKLLVNRPVLQVFEDEYPIVRDLFEYRRARKFMSTYIDPMDGRDVVHPNIWQIGAWTSRMSMSRPNMQNIPVRGEGSSELREMFVPRPGYCFVVSDYDSIEVRLLAYYLNDPGFKAMIAAGLDPHAWMASKIWGGEPAAYAKGTAGEKQRGVAKNVLFAITYGAGGGKVLGMLRDAGIPIDTTHHRWHPSMGKGAFCQCQGCKLAKKIKGSLPGYWNLAGRNGRVQKKVRALGHVNTMWGRRQPVAPDKAYVGLNALIQGTAAEILKQGIINTASAVKHLGALPVLFVHDEIATECPVEHAEECRRLQDEAMRAACDILDPQLEVASTIALHSYAEGK